MFKFIKKVGGVLNIRRRLSNTAIRTRVAFWLNLFRLKDSVAYFGSKHGSVITVLILLCLAVTSIWHSNSIQHYFNDWAPFELKTDSVSTLLNGVGLALVGSSAIAFSFIMFAMQVNVERVPYGLFKKLSADRILLAFFVATVLLSIGVAMLPLFETELLTPSR